MIGIGARIDAGRAAEQLETSATAVDPATAVTQVYGGVGQIGVGNRPIAGAEPGAIDRAGSRTRQERDE